MTFNALTQQVVTTLCQAPLQDFVLASNFRDLISENDPKKKIELTDSEERWLNRVVKDEIDRYSTDRASGLDTKLHLKFEKKFESFNL